MRTAFRSVIALMCVFGALNALAITSGSPGVSITIASQGTSQAVSIANDEVTSLQVAAIRFTKLAATLNLYAAAADKDGTLASAQTALLKYSGGTSELAQTSFANLQSFGFKGTEEQVEQSMSALTPEAISALQKQVATVGLKSVLLSYVTELNKMASEVAANPTAKLHLASAHLKFIDCTLMGEWMAIAAIGAVASLGGVNPLGDLLTAVGAVGGFVCYVY